MTTYIALLRAINVGGTGLLPMKDLSAMCEKLGCRDVRTYIQSGNVVFTSSLSEEAVRKRLEEALAAKMGKPIDVMIRTQEELRTILSRNPFQNEDPGKVVVGFLSAAPPKDLMKKVVAPGGEQVKPGKREVYVYYPNGQGRSKLKLPLEGAAVTARNIRTAAALLAMAEQTS